ncbi:MlaD family protein [Rhodanobacter sp. MP1X3]|uniref:PqiB family protein n=1 Tax=Rhodanobacter sp. MP1X3 TaxID=2723086 RepID=UPI00161A4BD0|nr:MlaD family protein [Rhodanobacter sp. MP1X3]MBB6242516.1 paraquat-inducible protein B [Rhodanobacter sp. MP1X3]
MNDTFERMTEPGYPVVSRSGRRLSLVWLVPLVAALIGLSMLVQAWLSAGPVITITFQTAAGLEVDKTPVKYKDVTVGTVSSITLSDDGSHVIATVALLESAESLARADTRFWVVRPRIGLNGVSGIDTLLSGAYIGVDKGKSSQSNKAFAGLETPPTVINGAPGRSFVLHTDDLGSLYIGSPVYYRRIQVGHVAYSQLDPDGKHVSVQIFIDAPYDRFVAAGTRFWNASGVDVSLDAKGLKLSTQSLTTLIAGGIAFATPPDDVGAPAITAYDLAKDQQSAMAPPDGPARYIQLRFEKSLHGLSVGASVEFSGLDIGRVVAIDLDYDPIGHRFFSVVGIEVYAQRMGSVLNKLPKPDGDPQRQAAQFLRGMVEHGLRAQVRSDNLLTGQLYVSLDFMPNATPVTFDVDARPLAVPTMDGGFDRLQEQVASIVGKIDKMPLEAIGNNLNTTLVDLDQTLKQVNVQLLPATTQTLQQARQTFGVVQGMLASDAPLQQNLGQTLQEVQRTARSLRVLTDLLSRHPEALLRGRPDDAPPVTSGSRSVSASQEFPR